MGFRLEAQSKGRHRRLAKKPFRDPGIRKGRRRGISAESVQPRGDWLGESSRNSPGGSL